MLVENLPSKKQKTLQPGKYSPNIYIIISREWVFRFSHKFIDFMQLDRGKKC